jgi:3-hydroxybutyrate dehydrogenase
MLSGRTALITGSTSGIGLGIAFALAREGCGIGLNGFGDPGEIARLTRRLAEDLSVKAVHYPADLSRPDEVGRMIEAARADFGAVDILVNNAGIQHVAPVEDFPAGRWDAILALNLTAPFLAIKAVLPGMKRRRWGRIINIASTHGLVGSEGKAAYVAAKHGLVGLTKVVALETATHGVTCNAICPGWVLTPLVEQQVRDLARNECLPEHEAEAALLKDKQPMAEFSLPEQIGALAVFLCGEAARTITGTALPMDGGWLAR